MKKKFKGLAALFAAAVMCASVIPASSISASADSFAPGDVDMNSQVDSSDALMIIRYSVGLTSFSDEQSALADVNKDNVVDSTDALTVLQEATGLISAIPEAGELTFAEEVVRLCNIERQKRGLNVLEMDPALCECTDIRVAELVENYEHNRPHGENWSSVLQEKGYKSLICGENITANRQTPEDTVTDWMNSQLHRDNILNPEFTKVGVSYLFVEDSRYGYYCDQILAKVGEDITDDSLACENFIAKVNAARKEKGLSPLEIDPQLTEIAEIRAKDIVVENSGTRPDGSDWKKLAQDRGIEYQLISEIRSRGDQNENELFNNLVNDGSPKFLNGEAGYTKIGFGHTFVANDVLGHYWSIVLETPFD